MKIVISGPFGLGSRADEWLLAGLARQIPAKRDVTVLSANPARTNTLHGGKFKSLKLSSPQAMLSATPVWRSIEEANLFILCGAGVLSQHGTRPSRIWLSQLENARLAKSMTALFGIGALPIEAKRDKASIQRHLRLFADGLMFRDSQSKQIALTYGLTSSTVQSGGNPVFSFGGVFRPAAAKGTRKIALLLTQTIPAANSFEFEPPKKVDGMLMQSYQRLIDLLLAEKDTELLVFLDEPADGNPLDELFATDNERVEVVGLHDTRASMQMEKLAACHAAFATSVHGVMAASAVGVPCYAPAIEPGTSYWLSTVGLGANALPGTPDAPFDPETAAASILTAARAYAEIRPALADKVKAIARRETKTWQLLETLVPWRVIRTKLEAAKDKAEEEGEAYDGDDDDLDNEEDEK